MSDGWGVGAVGMLWDVDGEVKAHPCEYCDYYAMAYIGEAWEVERDFPGLLMPEDRAYHTVAGCPSAGVRG